MQRYELFLLSIFVVLASWFFFCEHHHLVGKVGYPLLREAQPLVVLSDREYSLNHSGILIVILVEYIADSFFCHSIESFLEH